VAGNDDTKSDAGSNPSTEAIFAEINQQTGVIDWQELVKHFARGVVIRVDADLDLVKVAHSMSLDDKAQMQQWLEYLHGCWYRKKVPQKISISSSNPECLTLEI